MDLINEPPTIGLSIKTHSLLSRLKEDGHFSEMVDGYRFGIALALSKNIIPDEIIPPKTTIFNVGTLDPDKSIYKAIKLLTESEEISIYRLAERLAEWGIIELTKKSETGVIDFNAIISESAHN